MLIYIRRCARLPIHSSSQTQGKTTQSMNFTTVFLYWKNDCHSPQKGILVSWCHNLMRRNVNAYRAETESASKQSKPTVFRWKKIRTLHNALLRITRSSHSLSTTYLGLLHSGSYEWTFQALRASKTSCRNQKHCYRQKPPDCLHVMILQEADLHLLVLKRWNLFDEN